MDDARDLSALQSKTNSTRSTASSEARERTQLIGRLLALYPARGEVEITLAAYCDETSDIPIPWLQLGIRRFRDDPERVFLPAISELRTACAKAIRHNRNVALGIPPGNSVQQLAIDVGALLKFGREVVPSGIAQLAAWASAKRINDGIAARNQVAIESMMEYVDRSGCDDLHRPSLGEYVDIAKGK